MSVSGFFNWFHIVLLPCPIHTWMSASHPYARHMVLEEKCAGFYREYSTMYQRTFSATLPAYLSSHIREHLTGPDSTSEVSVQLPFEANTRPSTATGRKDFSTIVLASSEPRPSLGILCPVITTARYYQSIWYHVFIECSTAKFGIISSILRVAAA